MKRRTSLFLVALGIGTLVGCRDFNDNVEFEIPESVTRNSDTPEDMDVEDEDAGLPGEDAGVADEDAG